MSDAAERRWILAIFAIALGLRVGFAMVLPPFQAPDERAHLDYVRTLGIDHGLPVQPQLAPGEALASWPQSYQPPLAYLSFAPVAWTSHALGAGPVVMLRALRLQNALYGALLVLVVHAVAARLRPRGDALRLLAPLLVATLPGLASNAGSLNNDGLANLLAACFWWVWLRQPPGLARGVAAGGVLGAACLAKLTAATLTPLCLLLPWLEGRDLRGALLEACAAGAAWLFLLAPWMARNASLYGDPLAVGIGSFSFESLAAAGLPQDLLDRLSTPAPGKALLQLFGRFGITNNLSVSAVPWLWIPLSLAGAAGWLRARGAGALRGLHAASLCAAVALATLGLVTFSLRYYGAWQGRYLYVAILPLALLLGRGLALLLPPGPPHRRVQFAVAALAVVLGGLVCAVLIGLSSHFGHTPRGQWGIRAWL